MLRTVLSFFIFATLSVFLQSCGYTEATYFRKYKATVEDERRDWGLCGGNFYKNGQVYPVISKPVLKCMRAKGYMTMNDYYVEDQIWFLDRRKPDKTYINRDLERMCGIKSLKSSACASEAYIVESNLQHVVSCMEKHGYEPALPRNHLGYRIVKDDRNLSPFYCLSLTPKNGKGGVSLFQHRIEW